MASTLSSSPRGTPNEPEKTASLEDGDTERASGVKGMNYSQAISEESCENVPKEAAMLINVEEEEEEEEDVTVEEVMKEDRVSQKK